MPATRPRSKAIRRQEKHNAPKGHQEERVTDTLTSPPHKASNTPPEADTVVNDPRPAESAELESEPELVENELASDTSVLGNPDDTTDLEETDTNAQEAKDDIETLGESADSILNDKAQAQNSSMPLEVEAFENPLLAGATWISEGTE